MKELERPQHLGEKDSDHYENLFSNTVYHKEINDYCDQLESERDEYKLKEEIAYAAKEIAEKAYQKAIKERDEWREKWKKLIVEYNEDLRREFVGADKQELQTLKEAVNKLPLAHDPYGRSVTDYGKAIDKLKELIK